MTIPRPRAIILWLVIAVPLLAGAAINLVPFLWMISTSLKTAQEVFAYPPTWIPDPITGVNYRKALDVVHSRVFLNSLIFSGSIVILQGLVTTMGGFGFARSNFNVIVTGGSNNNYWMAGGLMVGQSIPIDKWR